MEFYKVAEHRDELYHWGIKGMRWGVRRYQNPDGSLTAAGKKRRSLGEVIHDHKVAKKRKQALEKARVTKAANKEAEEKAKEAAEKRAKDLAAGKIPAKKMTDQELSASISRLQAEQRYKEAVLETRPIKRLMSKTWSDAIVPGITQGGKDLVSSTLKKYGSDLLGLNKKDPKTTLEKLKEEQQTWEAKEKISKSKKNIQLDNDYFENRKEKQAQKAKQEAQKQVDEYNAKQEKAYQDSRAGEPYRMKGAGSTSGSSDNLSSVKNYLTPSVMNTPVSSSRTNNTINVGEQWVKENAEVLSRDRKEVLTTTTVKTKKTR